MDNDTHMQPAMSSQMMKALVFYGPYDVRLENRPSEGRSPGAVMNILRSYSS